MKSKLFAIIFVLLALHAQSVPPPATVYFTQRTEYLESTFYDGGGASNQGADSIKMWANEGFAVAFRRLKTNGNNTGDNRPMQVGDRFTITVSAKRAYGRIGVALLASPSALNGWEDRISNYAISVNQDGPLFTTGNTYTNWYVQYSGGYILESSLGVDQDNYYDYAIQFVLTAPNMMNIRISDNRPTPNEYNFYDVQLNTENPITHYSIYLWESYKANDYFNIFWKPTTSMTATGTLAIGESNNTLTISHALTNGLAANSTTNTVYNSLYKKGSGTLILEGANTYTGYTYVDAGTLQLNRTGGGTLVSTNNVIVNSGGTLKVSTNQTLNNLTVNTGANLLVDEGATLTINGTLAIDESVAISGNLTIASGATLTVASGKTLTVNGTLALDESATIGGNLTVASGGNLTLASGKTLTVNGGLEINESVTLDGNLYINGGTAQVAANKGLSVNGTLTNFYGSLTIKSNVSGTGSLIHSSSGVNATVERYFAGTEQWRLVSSPVASQSISGGWTPSGTYPSGHGYDFYAWDEATSTWLNQRIPGNNITSFISAKGYLVSFQETDPTKQFGGALNTGSVSINLTKTGSGDYSGTNLVGNPYPSSIDWKAASGWTRSMLKDDDAGEGVGYTMYIYNPSTNNYGAYISNSSSDEGTHGVTRYIPPMQGFFVVASSAGSFGMDNDVRVHNNAGNFLKNKGAEANIIRASVTGANVGSDEVMIEFGNKQGGAPKWNSMVATAPSLWVSKNDKRYSIYFHHNNQQTESLPVSFKAGANGQYTLSFEFAQGQYHTLRLQDLKTNTIHDLLAANSYAFSATTSDDPNRFLLVLGTVGVDENPADQAQLQAYMANGLLWVNNPAENSQLAVFDLSGRMLVQQQLRSKGLQQLSLNLQKGAYILRLTEGNSSLSTKVINQ